MHSVLVAHNGNSFDFRILLSHIERHELSWNWFEKYNVKFADSLQYLRKVSLKVTMQSDLTTVHVQVRREPPGELQQSLELLSELKLQKVFHKFFPKEKEDESMYFIYNS
jgi:hypothetical protein